MAHTNLFSFHHCTLCPRACQTDRLSKPGFCGATDKLKVARASLHLWEEPCISGTNGSGAIFFSGCQLQCIFCQNAKLSHDCFGLTIDTSRLAQIMLELQSQGAHNINLVTPTPYVLFIIDALDKIRTKLHIPVIYNCGGYETIQTIQMLQGYVQIYMPDFKYWENSLAAQYSKVNNYRETAMECIKAMVEQVGAPVFDGSILQSGVLVRHLVLPSHRKDSEEILSWLHDTFGDQILLSLMSQYTPPANPIAEFPHLNRRITGFEYTRVLRYAETLGFSGYMQDKSSAKEIYTPLFHGEGVL